MRNTSMILPLLACLSLAGCDDGELRFLSKTEAQTIEQLKTGQYELVKRDDLAQLRKDAELGRSVNRYQLHRDASNTWRLDTATGQTCLMLATEGTWQSKQGKSQLNCADADYRRWEADYKAKHPTLLK